MIEIFHISSAILRHQLIETHLNELRLGSASWVVTDVRSKLAIQRRLIEVSSHSSVDGAASGFVSGFVSGRSVLRANEVWQEAARKIDPELQIISRELMLTAIAEWLAERDEVWLKAPGAAKTGFAYIRQLLPIIAIETEDDTQNPETSALEEWLSTEQSSRDRWQAWYRISKDLWKRLKEKKLCAAAWLPGWLVSYRDQLDSVLPRNFVFDLGAELSHVESELLLALAVKREIRILRPSPDWEADYPDSRLAADWIAKQAALRNIDVVVHRANHETTASSVPPTSAVLRKYLRLPSAGAEVKQAVATTRKWLEAGVSPLSVAIVAPDLEAYWPLLSVHLEAEGIPSSKAVVSPLHSFPDMMKWLARLRVRVGVPEPRDLETDVFGDRQPSMNFQSFREIFSRIYEVEDLELSSDLIRYFEDEFQDRGRWQDLRISRDKFVAMAGSLLRAGDDLTRATRALKSVLEECPPDMEFHCAQWVKYFAETLAKTELTVIPSMGEGIWCVNLASLEGLDCSHVVALGLHEGALRSNLGTAMQTVDLRSIERDLGFVLEGEDRKRTEFEARWNLLQGRAETLLLFADTDVGGTVQTPSWTWLSGAWEASAVSVDGKTQERRTPEITVPDSTRFDALMRRRFEDIGSKAQRARLNYETGNAESVRFGAGLMNKLSASTIDAVSRCPLKFGLSRIFALRDPGEIDLDLDANRQGSLQHKIFERLGLRQWPALSDEELGEVIDAAKSDLETADRKPMVRSLQAWNSLRRRLLRTARAVLEFERAERVKHPDLSTLDCEVKFEGMFPRDSSGSSTVKVTGSIDRIDHDSKGRALIIDYKNRAYNQNFSTWARNQFWQPLVYAYAFEQGWAKLDRKLDLAGIFIFDVTKKSRGNGLRLAEGNLDLFEIVDEKKVRYMQDRADLENSYQQLKNQVEVVSEILETGDFRPEPFKKDECDRCQWIFACRAPHLELST